MQSLVAQVLQALKKQLGPMILCSTVTALCLGAMLYHYQTAGSFDLISKMETQLLDVRFGLRGQEQPSGKVGILAIDEASIQSFGRFPFPRRYYRQALQNLKKYGVRWVGFDVTFSEPERPLLEEAWSDIETLKTQLGLLSAASPSGQSQAASSARSQLASSLEQLEIMRQASLGDQSLALGIEEFENTVLGYFFYNSKIDAEALGDQAFSRLEPMLDSEIVATILPDGKELDDYRDLKAFAVIGNIDLVAEAGQYFGFFSNQADEDAIIRWGTLLKNLNGTLMPSLSLRLAAAYLEREPVVVFDELGVEEIMLVNPEDDSDILTIPTDPLGVGRMLIKHRGPGHTIPHFSLADAYNDSFTEAQKTQLEGKLLILGPTAVAIADQRPNPFDPSINGVENHAAMVDNMISNDFMQRPRYIYFKELGIVLGIALVFSPLLIFLSALWSGIIALVFATGYFFFDQWFWFQHGVWAYLGMPYILIFSLFIVVTLYRYVTEEAEKKKVKGAFAHYLSPEVIDQVLDDPDSLRLGGEKKELTVFFSDVRSFTTISENLPPETLCEFMNDYFTPMTSIILKTGGVLDKYIGDAVMAFWGAPVPLEDQADRAAFASLKMLLALDELQVDFEKRGLPSIDIGIGLNTGAMSVGNMGSVERFCYTVMGDAVNLGARLEGLTKEYGVKILISQSTRDKLSPNRFITRDLDDIRVKGKNEPVRVFELMRPDMMLDEREVHQLASMFEQGRQHYRQQEWDKAFKVFEQCLLLYAEDGPTLLYLKRVEDYRRTPPKSDWDGVYTFTHK